MFSLQHQQACMFGAHRSDAQAVPAFLYFCSQRAQIPVSFVTVCQK